MRPIIMLTLAAMGFCLALYISEYGLSAFKTPKVVVIVLR